MGRLKLLGLEPSDRKKFVAVFSDGDRVHFGGRGCMDYTLYHTERGRDVATAKRRAYIARHRVNERWRDPKSPGTLSRYILWEFPTLSEAIKKYNARFFS